MKNALEFLSYDEAIDLLILDIEMPGMTGLELKEQLQRAQAPLKVELLGSLPSDFFMQDSDICVLFGNAFSNAKEALQRVEGERKLSLRISKYKDNVVFYLSNSTPEEDVFSLATDKRDREHHGYGVKNMRQIVGKYGGEISWERQRNEVVLKVELFEEGSL